MADPLYILKILPDAAKQLERIPRRFQIKIGEKIRALSHDPAPPISKQLALLKKYGHFRRIRVAEYRVIYCVKHKTLLVLVVEIAHRREAYRNLEPFIKNLAKKLEKLH